MHREIGAVIKRQRLAPGYKRIKEGLGPQLARLQELAKKPGKLSRGEEAEIPKLLAQVQLAASDRIEERTREYNRGELGRLSFEERLSRFEEEFGHPHTWPNFKRKKFEGSNCVLRAITTDRVLSDFDASSRGVIYLLGTGHIAPTIRI